MGYHLFPRVGGRGRGGEWHGGGGGVESASMQHVDGSAWRVYWIRAVKSAYFRILYQIAIVCI